MRIMRFAALGLIVAVTGCHAKSEATSGKEFLEKFQSAASSRDDETIWKMLSKMSRDTMLEQVKRELKAAAADPIRMRRLRQRAGLTADPAGTDPAALALLLASRPLLEDKALAGLRYMEEKKTKSDGEEKKEYTVLILQKAGGEREEWVLDKEDGYLRLNVYFISQEKSSGGP